MFRTGERPRRTCVYLSIDNYLADLNVAIDGIGAPVDLVGLCQGGWLSKR